MRYKIRTYYDSLVEYDYDRTSHNCTCDDICRCSIIEDFRIVGFETKSPWHSIIMEIKKTNTVGYRNYSYCNYSKLDEYCIERIMVKLGSFVKENYSPVICGGYYGEEFNGFTFVNDTPLTTTVYNMLQLETDIEKVLFTLGVEYSYIADIVAESTKVSVVEFKLSDITPSAGSMMMKNQTEYILDLDDKILGVVKGNLLIDGNHRYSYLLGKYGSDFIGKYLVLE